MSIVIGEKPHEIKKEIMDNLKKAEEEELAKLRAEPKANNILRNSIDHLADRADTYDSSGGERSIERTVAMFNELTGHTLSEEEGWAFMLLLKLARSTQGQPKQDTYEDGAAYFALMGEAAIQGERLE